jgi:hypothetical protein
MRLEEHRAVPKVKGRNGPETTTYFEPLVAPDDMLVLDESVLPGSCKGGDVAVPSALVPGAPAG